MTGSGTALDPYIINDVADLQAMENDLAAFYELGSDIDASATSGWNGGLGFDPIILFTGELDGKGSTISGLFINRPTEPYVALIGYANAAIVLKNIKMTGVDITGGSVTGALLGYAGSGDVVDIDNCNSAGSVSSPVNNTGQIGGLIGNVWDGTIDDCWLSCLVTVSGNVSSQVGGLIGYSSEAVITNCYATGAVVSGKSRIGGLIGDLWAGTVTKCYATGNVSGLDYVGGLIGRISQDPTITNCYARGNATASGYYVGGFCGRNHTGVIDDCYSTGAATGAGLVGGFCGEAYGTITNCFWDTETSGNATSDGGTGRTTTQMKTRATFTGAGWDFTTPIPLPLLVLPEDGPAKLGVQ